MAHNYVIIGIGPCGIAAASAIHEKEPDCNLTIIGDDPHGFYSRPGLAYYLTGESSERQLSLPQAAAFRRVISKVISVNAQAHQVTTEDCRVYAYHKLLLATGSTASKISNPGADLRGVVKLDSLEDAKEIINAARKSKAAAVVGGGVTALEIVEGLVARGIETHYLLRSDRYWPNVLDEVESAIVEKRLKSHGVRIHYHSQLARIVGKQDKVIGVETESGEQIKCQIVAVAIGVQPRMELAMAAGLKTDRGILTDEYLQTSAPHIFAAGDAAQIFDPVSGKALLDALWGKALAQ
ncbi:MAG: FAD-dependent oxidoreductase, partial [Dehalococcoidia bacterium]|nr:FAD-dependent oxidoreductase [Dehalococcoidia bacterium]